MSEKRDSFRSRWGFILACIGSAVGMGNIWMFPQRVSVYGGGTFLIPYFIFVFLIASSGVIGEMGFGRATKSGPIGAFGAAFHERRLNKAAGEGLGLIPVLGSLMLAIGYSVVVGWILKYTVGAFTGSTINPANLQEIIAGGAPQVAAFGAKFDEVAVAFGNNIWQIIGIVIAIGILIMGIGSGIEKANKIMMPLFFFLFVALGVYIAFLPGAKDGYKFIFSFNIEGWKDPKVWIYAMGQAFFSLSIAGNGTLIYGSYLSDNEDIPASALNVAFFDTLAAVLAAFVIIPAMATTGVQLDKGGPGLMFVFLPNIFRDMPLGWLVTIVFFVAVLFAGMTSLINLYEAPIATLQEKFGLDRKKATLAIGGIGIVVSVLIQGIIGQWMDALSIYVCPLGAAMAGILFFWVYGEKRVKEELEKGRKNPLPAWIIPLSKYIYCAMAIVVLVLGAIWGGIG
ncbi:MAG: sodium-dependent transporter [Eubacteriales bacterium]|nr:sodium-dependent transporter [Eubacteriales bacterium]